MLTADVSPPEMSTAHTTAPRRPSIRAPYLEKAAKQTGRQGGATMGRRTRSTEPTYTFLAHEALEGQGRRLERFRRQLAVHRGRPAWHEGTRGERSRRLPDG